MKSLSFAAVFFPHLLAVQAYAQCATSSSNVAFGVTDPAAGNTTTGVVTANCPGGFGSFPYLWVCIGMGVGANSTSVVNRTMASGANKLSYQLYTTSSYSTTYTLSPPNNQFSVPYSNSTGATITSTTYAKVLAGQTSPPGTYTDTYAGAGQAAISGNVASTLPGNCLGGLGPLSFSVTATVNASCNVAATNMSFGATGVLNSNIDATSTISVTCTNTTPYYVNLGPGLNSSGGTRRMIQSGRTVNYNLYRDSGRTQVWGNVFNVDGVSQTGAGLTQNLTVYGRVFQGQTTPDPGVYSDTVGVTVTY